MKVLFWLFRLIFGVSLILYGCKGLTEVNTVKEIGFSHLDIIESKIPFNLQIVKDYGFKLVQIANLAMIYGGLLTMFGFCTAKYFTLFAVIIEGLFVASARVRSDEFGYTSGLVYLAFAGLVMST